MAFTTTQFITNVRTRGRLPDSSNSFTDAQILAAGDSEIRTFILPMVMKSQEAYYSYDVDNTISSNTTGLYEVPTRAIGGKLNNIALISGTDRLDLNWIQEEELTRTDQPYYGVPACYLKRSQVQLLPTDGAGFTTFRITILLRPGDLVATTTAAQITAISGTTLTFASLPSTFTTAKTYDFIQNDPHFDHVEIDKTATTITATTMVFASVSSRLAVDDWVSLAETSPIVQVPVELWPLLEQSVVNYCLRAQGDMEAIGQGEKHLDKMMKAISNLYTPRIEKEGKKIVNRSRLIRRV